MINISESASIRLKSFYLLKNHRICFCVLGVKAGGCSGFSYGMGFDDEQKDDDKVFHHSWPQGRCGRR